MIKNALVQNKKRQWGLIRHARRSSKLQTSCWCETGAELKVLPHRASLPLTCCRAAEQRVSLDFSQETIKRHKDSSPNRNVLTFNTSNNERLCQNAFGWPEAHCWDVTVMRCLWRQEIWIVTHNTGWRPTSCVLDERDTFIRKRLIRFYSVHRIIFLDFFHHHDKMEVSMKNKTLHVTFFKWLYVLMG